MARPAKGRYSWIIVRDKRTGRYFHDHSSEREGYRRDKDFEVLPGTYRTRAEARERIRSLQ